jgi:hypothetical protein
MNSFHGLRLKKVFPVRNTSARESLINRTGEEVSHRTVKRFLAERVWDIRAAELARLQRRGYLFRAGEDRFISVFIDAFETDVITAAKT